MEIQKIYSDPYDEERLYSVLMDEDEIRMFANIINPKKLLNVNLSPSLRSIPNPEFSPGHIKKELQNMFLRDKRPPYTHRPAGLGFRTGITDSDFRNPYITKKPNFL